MGIIQSFFGGYPAALTSIWSVPFSDFVDGSNSYTISNLQIGDLVFFISTHDNEEQDPIPGWTTLISGFNDPDAMASFRKAIVDTSFTIPSSWMSSNVSDNFAAVVVRSTKNTITLLDQAALGSSSTGFVSIPSSNFGNQAIPSLTNDPFSIVFGFYADDDVTSSSAPTDWTYLGLNANSGSTVVSAYSLEASSGDTAPPGAGNSFGNPSSGSDNNTSIVLYASTDDRTVRTWSVVDSVFQDIEDDGTGLTGPNRLIALEASRQQAAGSVHFRTPTAHPRLRSKFRP